MPAPLIGLTTRSLSDPTSRLPLIASPRSYTQMLMQCGAIPVLIPLNLKPEYYSDLLSRLDAVIFTGGGDIEPARYNGVPHEQVSYVDHERDHSEINLLEQALSQGTPFLGICRGLQVINVALGGDLYTHVLDQHPGALQHSCFPQNPPGFRAHMVDIQPNTILAQILGTSQTEVNSLHHQGIRSLAPDVVPLASAPDGLVEAVQVPGNPFGIAVQWHPEWLPDDPASQALFYAFIDTALEHQLNGNAGRELREHTR